MMKCSPGPLRIAPNLITAVRIVGAICLSSLDVSPQILSAFWFMYLLCGLTDIADGYTARRFYAVTRVGAMLDSYADIIFVACCAYKLWPTLILPSWMWIWAGGIVAIKVINLVSALVVHRELMFPHTTANKLTGLFLFISIPLFVFFEQIFPLVITAGLATFAAIQEGHVIRTSTNKTI